MGGVDGVLSTSNMDYVGTSDKKGLKLLQYSMSAQGSHDGSNYIYSTDAHLQHESSIFAKKI